MKKEISESTIVGKKKVIIEKNISFDKAKIFNNFEQKTLPKSFTDVDQFEAFKKLFVNNSGISEQQFKQIYLSTYKEIVKIFFNSSKLSVFLKSPQELGTSFSGLQLLQNAEFDELIDTQKEKEDLMNRVNENPCIVLDPEPDQNIHPLRLEMIKTNIFLSMKVHITDFKLRNILLTSVFDNKSFYEKDTTLVDYLFQTYIERQKNISTSFYNSIYILMHKDLNNVLEEGEELFDPITNKKINFEIPLKQEKIEEDSLKYIKYIFYKQFIEMSNVFNDFLDTTIKQKGKSFKLSNFLKPRNFLINSLKITNNKQDIPNNTFYLKPIFTNNKINLELSLKTENNIEVIIQRTNPITLPNNFSRIEQVSQDVINTLKQEILNSSTLDIVFDYIFPLNKILNYVSINNILLVTKLYDGAGDIFNSSAKTVNNLHGQITGDASALQNNKCQAINANFGLTGELPFGFEADILKLILQAPLAIIKGLEETFDPNIAISSKIKLAAEAAGAPDISIIPYSTLLMIPPPFGPMIPVIPPMGFVYWGISAAETAYNLANGTGKGSKTGYDNLNVETEKKLKVKNPFKPLC